MKRKMDKKIGCKLWVAVDRKTNEILRSFPGSYSGQLIIATFREVAHSQARYAVMYSKPYRAWKTVCVKLVEWKP